MGRTITRAPDAGISIIEVMVAALIITVALLGIAMTMTQGIFSVYYTQEQLIAKQKAREALESVFTARSTQNITFPQIQNTTVNGGIFLTGFQPIYGMGGDGIANTTDDDTTIETITFPGNDGLLATADDQIRTLNDFQRKITISSVLDGDGNTDPDIRRITVEVRFKMNNLWKSVTVSSYVSRYA
jgi:type II secretory pathway pseudopilin PulG